MCPIIIVTITIKAALLSVWMIRRTTNLWMAWHWMTEHMSYCREQATGELTLIFRLGLQRSLLQQ
jgi:hypothetical protein